ncbi:MAG: DUF5615 family PIN-like protein, partial [Pacificimonas sp.]
MAESACKFLTERGHEVLRAKDKVPEGTPDPIVAKVAQDLEAILLTDDSDFDTVAARRPDGQKQRFRRLSRIRLGCKHAKVVERLTAAISLVEFEYEIA